MTETRNISATLSSSEAAVPLPEELAPQESVYDTDYETGQDNIDFWGLDIHNPVFFMSAVAVLSFVLVTLAFPDIAHGALVGARDWVLDNFDWFFVVATNIVFIFCLVVGLSPLGRIRLGGADAKPDFGTLSWFSMLFAAGVGIGLLFYGAAEPLAYYTGDSGTPLGVAPLSDEARRLAFSATIFHWGVTPWAIYAAMGLALAFFTFNKGLPLTVRSAFYPLLGDRVWGWPGHMIDFLAVIATLFGLATSLGIGATQAASGLNFLFDIDNGVTTQLLLIAAISCITIFSVVRGLDGGVKLLSNINIVIAIGLLIFVILAGPTWEIVKSYASSSVAYIVDSPRLSSWFNREDEAWYHGWTIFYWAWWVSWSPFVGMFIARVSRGRTVREFLTAVICVPVLVGVIWFNSFGVTALDQFDKGIGALPDGISDMSLVLFHMLANLPFSTIISSVAVVLLIVFFVTSSDSGSLVIDSITAGGKLDAPIPQRAFWAIMQGLVAAVLLVGGGVSALSSLQAGAIAAGLPFTLILLVCCVSLYRGLVSELPNIPAPTSTRKPSDDSIEPTLEKDSSALRATKLNLETE